MLVPRSNYLSRMSSNSRAETPIGKARSPIAPKPHFRRQHSKAPTIRSNDSTALTDSPQPSPLTGFPSARTGRRLRYLLDRSKSEPSGNLFTLKDYNNQDPPETAGLATADAKVDIKTDDRKDSTGKETAPTTKRSSGSSAYRSFRDQVRARYRSIAPFTNLSEGSSDEEPSETSEVPVERIISRSGIMQRRAKVKEQQPPTPMAPMRPPHPHARTISGIVHQRTVNLETPFASPMPRAYTAIPLGRLSTKSTSETARKLTVWKRIQRFPMRIVNLGIKSSPKRRRKKGLRSREHEDLHRVTSILDQIVLESTPPINCQAEPLPEALLDAHLKKAQRNATFHLPAGIRTRYRAHSDASTDSHLHPPRIQVPFNTPEGHETYKIKRGPSAETEEYMKIDITIKGGTSYLPSEARRIQTPPLPGDGPGEKRTPFFFDYTAPGDELSRKDGPSDAGKAVSNESSHRASENGPGDNTDWIIKELAEVDAVGEKRESMSRVDNREILSGNVDLNVPEHLPTSPLCPRHPKHRSGGTQICWMHGQNKNRP